MASGKRGRASMREGPLAELFRRTEGKGEKPAEPAPDAPAKDTTAEPAATAPATAAGREGGYPHPSLGAPKDAPAERAPTPSPQERLRHAFSSDIPDNILAKEPAPHLDRETARAQRHAAGPRAGELRRQPVVLGLG